MNQQPTPSEQLPGAEASVLQTLSRHSRWLKFLTTAAVVFWAIAIVGNVSLFICYRVFYQPKEKQMFREIESLRRRNESPRQTPPVEGASRMTTETALSIHYLMTFIMTRAILAVAALMTVLSAGTMITLVVAILHRRLTLQQLHVGLAQISSQLAELRPEAGRGT